MILLLATPKVVDAGLYWHDEVHAVGASGIRRLGIIDRLRTKRDALGYPWSWWSASSAPVFGMALYSAKAVLAGRAGDVWELVTENL